MGEPGSPAGEGADFLDDPDLPAANGLQDDVRLVLLLDSLKVIEGSLTGRAVLSQQIPALSLLSIDPRMDEKRRRQRSTGRSSSSAFASFR
jgi:hypothetical protein